MRKLALLLTILSLTAGVVYQTKAQQANLKNIGSVKGLLKDTVHNYTVKSATVSVYRSDSTLVNYQLSNNYGEFSFNNLPLNSKYYIEVSHISYQLLRQNFTLSTTQSAVALKVLIVKPMVVTLNEVKISIPPIQMNGDTLEFNAAAFKLDSNAVVEDLLKKIPNVTLWGDGQITVNGREVKSLLVNGKEFFGGDFKMATQNIAKNALEKVQVYNVQRDKNNPLDSTLTVNLKLKKGKDTGYFGKIGGGYGTTERFEADGNINRFTPKLQISLVAAGNNTNKIANNINMLTANSTFKGTGVNVEYQPDFRATGISQTNTGGVAFNYNFIEKPTYENKRTLTGNYFIQNRNNDVLSNNKTTTTIGDNAKIFDHTSNTNNSASTNQNFDSKFEYAKQNSRLNISQNVSFVSGKSENKAVRSSENQQNQQTSTNNTLDRSNYANKGFAFKADYDYNNYVNYKQKIRSFTIRYNLDFNENGSERIDQTAFRSFIDPNADRDFNRSYNNGGRNLSQQLFTEVPALKKLFFGDKNLAGIEFKISNELSLNTATRNNMVSDFEQSVQAYTQNSYLSNNLKINTLNEIPALTFSKSYHKGLSNRFSRNLSFSVSAKHRFVYQNSRSDKQFQNISRNYNNFVPAASISYFRAQYGEYTHNLTVDFNTFFNIPTIDQLAPLTDSTNVYRLQRGNLNLKESKTKKLSLSFNHTDQSGKNTLNYNISASASITADAFADSIFIDKLNRRTVYQVNSAGQKSANLGADVRKALKFKTSALQISLGGNLSLSKTPGYVNDVFNFSDNLNTSGRLSFYYTYKDKIALQSNQNADFYRNRQNAFNTSYSGTNLSSSYSGSYNINKKLTLNSNISLNSNKPSGAKAINCSIWNASAICRFLKGNNAELKLTALDLLRQNNSITNTSYANSFTFANRNVLQQYFMTTLSYYPRKFGKNEAKK